MPLQIVVNLLPVCERQISAVLFASSRNRPVDFTRLAASCLWQACYYLFSTKLQQAAFINLRLTRGHPVATDRYRQVCRGLTNLPGWCNLLTVCVSQVNSSTCSKSVIFLAVYIARVTPNRRIQDGVATGQKHKKLYYELQVFGLFWWFNCVESLLTKLSIAENFKEWTFGQFAWIIWLVTLRITTDCTYLRKDVYCGCFWCELESGCRIFTNISFVKDFLK